MEDANFKMKMTCQLKPGVLEKRVQGLSDTKRMVPDDAIPYGRPWVNQQVQ